MASKKIKQFKYRRDDHLYGDPHEEEGNLSLHYGDLTDSTNIIKVIQQLKPDEIYNLAAQSHVAVVLNPQVYNNCDALELLNSWAGIGSYNKTKIYQASTSELYGLVQETPQRESTPFY